MVEPPTRPQFRSITPWVSSTLSRAVTDLSWRHNKPTKRRKAASDELKLFCMGYKQDLSRNFTLFNNAGVAFSLLSPLAALTGTYGTWGLLYGGPVVMMWGMPVVTFFSLLVAVSLAELASAYPTSGAIYYWSWAMAPPRLKAVACWVSGWVLLLGQASFTAANCRIFTDLLAVFVLMATGGYRLPQAAQLAIYLAVLILSAAAASTPNHIMAYLTSLTTFWNLISLAALVVALPAVAPKRQSLSYIFTHWIERSDITGISSPVYNVLIGLLMSQYLYLGFDACAHLSEETHHADINAPRGMIAAAFTTALGGYFYLLSLNLVAVDPAALIDPNSESKGTHAVAQLFWNVHKAAYGDGRGGLALLTVPMVAALMCTHQCVAANARMLYAFSRDGAAPFHRYISRVETRTKAPLVAVWVMALLAAVIGVPMYFADPYMATIETLAVVNTYLAYGIPIFFKLLSDRSVFLPGPFYLGPRTSRVINVVAVVWILFITVIFSLPTIYPIDGENMNYNAAGTGLVILASLGVFYCPVVGGRHWFTGPRPNLGQFDDLTPLVQQRLDQARQQAQQRLVVSEQQQQEDDQNQPLLLQQLQLPRQESGGVEPLLDSLEPTQQQRQQQHWQHHSGDNCKATQPQPQSDSDGTGGERM